ncbi:MlaD family protein [Actinomadura parmotrematis]|uniref:MCE family protein n=1 Tax=Actinomadura parmotrematis TaxID=2864039 RepID=A0ABS7G3Q6_9ACTN|nr:MCE family protein [Actinomadura parmotrematis]MBW8487355.1 MCE family protein [Actinomadura parmotrematis]
MRNLRIVTNLAFFVLLGVLLSVWAVRSIIHIDALEKPFPVTADFASSPGLHSDLEVTHLGVRVGQVGSVRLAGDHVAVRLDLDRGVRVPSDVGARVLRKSAIGEPYIELSSPARKAGTPAPPLRAGDRIPLARTAGTTDYKQLFDGLSRTLDAVDPRDARTLVHELATGVQGRGGDLHDMIGDADRLTGTLAADAGTLDALAGQLTRLTATLTDHRGQIASGVDDLAALTAALRRSDRDLNSVLDQGPGTLRDLDRLLETARPGLDCLLAAAATPTAPLLTPANQARIRHVLQLIPTLRALVADITATDPSGDYLRVTPVITIAGSRAPKEYTTPVPKPAAPALTLCSAAGKAQPAAKAGTAAKAPAKAAASPGMTARPVAGREEAPPPSRWLPLLPPVLAGAVALAAVANVLRALRRRSSR